jgi:hypothetical protein
VDKQVARCVALLAGHGAILLFLVERLNIGATDAPSIHFGQAVLVILPLLGLVFAYLALRYDDGQRGYCEWTSAGMFFAMVLLWASSILLASIR